MKKLLDSANEYLRQSDWRDIAVLKFCLLSLGLMAGMQVPEKHRKTACIAASAVFTATYIPTMTKFLSVLIGTGKQNRKPPPVPCVISRGRAVYHKERSLHHP